MTEFTEVTFIVLSVVVLQAFLSVSQLTSQRKDSISQLAGSYDVDILSPDVHINEMKQVMDYMDCTDYQHTVVYLSYTPSYF